MAKTLHIYLRYLPLLIAFIFSALQPGHAAEIGHMVFEKECVKSAVDPHIVKAWEDLYKLDLPPTFRTNITNLNQRSLINE